MKYSIITPTFEINSGETTATFVRPVNCDLYGTYVCPGSTREFTIFERAEYLGASKPIARFGDWIITKGGIEWLNSEYLITWGELHRPDMDWVRHVGVKRHVNPIEFQMVYEAACAMSRYGSTMERK